jgi:hypothetical protein
MVSWGAWGVLVGLGCGLRLAEKSTLGNNSKANLPSIGKNINCMGELGIVSKVGKLFHVEHFCQRSAVIRKKLRTMRALT